MSSLINISSLLLQLTFLVLLLCIVTVNLAVREWCTLFLLYVLYLGYSYYFYNNNDDDDNSDIDYLIQI